MLLNFDCAPPNVRANFKPKPNGGKKFKGSLMSVQSVPDHEVPKRQITQKDPDFS